MSLAGPRLLILHTSRARLKGAISGKRLLGISDPRAPRYAALRSLFCAPDDCS